MSRACLRQTRDVSSLSRVWLEEVAVTEFRFRQVHDFLETSRVCLEEVAVMESGLNQFKAATSKIKTYERITIKKKNSIYKISQPQAVVQKYDRESFCFLGENIKDGSLEWILI
jgi:hypothetical protein